MRNCPEEIATVLLISGSQDKLSWRNFILAKTLHQASHYLSQCWSRTVSPYGVTRTQCWYLTSGNGSYVFAGVVFINCKLLHNLSKNVWTVSSVLWMYITKYSTYIFMRPEWRSISMISRLTPPTPSRDPTMKYKMHCKEKLLKWALSRKKYPIDGCY